MQSYTARPGSRYAHIDALFTVPWSNGIAYSLSSAFTVESGGPSIWSGRDPFRP